MGCTILDIAFIVRMHGHCTSNPEKVHWERIGRVMRYLKGPMDLVLHYIDSPTVMEGYNDES